MSKLRIRIRDPCFFDPPDPWSGMGKNPDPIQDHMSWSLVATFWFKNTRIFCCGSGSVVWETVPFLPGIWHKDPGSATLIYVMRFFWGFTQRIYLEKHELCQIWQSWGLDCSLDPTVQNRPPFLRVFSGKATPAVSDILQFLFGAFFHLL